MKDVRPIIAKNLAFFRKEKGLTQAELAEKLNYSDKAVSRWEHGDTLPDINILYSLCEFYGITMDILLDDETDKKEILKQNNKHIIINKIMIMIMSGIAVLLAAVVIFVYFISTKDIYYWQVFVWTVPATCVFLMVSGKNITNAVLKLTLNSIFIWGTLAAIFVQLLPNNSWYIFLIGIPLQFVASIWFVLKKLK
ncbi:MAG: helix-turn-helix transcriptional regulator [Clostridia bacterium]|nr:helix-turn-helix transcriptional regulator [Clostridia bacterium]